MYHTIEEAVKALKNGETTSEKLVQESIDTFETDKKSEKPLNAFLEIYANAIECAKEADAKIPREQHSRRFVRGEAASRSSFCEQGQHFGSGTASHLLFKNPCRLPRSIQRYSNQPPHQRRCDSARTLQPGRIRNGFFN